LYAVGASGRFTRTAHRRNGPIGPVPTSLTRVSDDPSARPLQREWEIKFEQDVGDVALDGVIAELQALRDGGVKESRSGP